MDVDLGTLATALYVSIDDELTIRPELARPRPEVGLCPRLSDTELLPLAAIQALLGLISETWFLRHASAHLRHRFPYTPGRSGYNQHLRRAGFQLRAVIRLRSIDPESWFDDTWLVGSTPVGCGKSRETAKRSDIVDYGAVPAVPGPPGACASISPARQPARTFLGPTTGTRRAASFPPMIAASSRVAGIRTSTSVLWGSGVEGRASRADGQHGRRKGTDAPKLRPGGPKRSRRITPRLDRTTRRQA